MFGINLTQAITDLTSLPEIQTFSARRVNKIKRKKNVITYGIERTENDWRDTMARYYLSLPYADTIELENYKILGKTLTVDVYVDVRTGNIKYYIFANNCLISTVGGCARIDFPVSASNPMGQSAQIRSNATNLVKSGVDISSGVAGIGKGLATAGAGAYTGNPSLIAGGLSSAQDSAVSTVYNVSSIPQSITGIRKPSPTTFNNNYTSGTCADDSTHAYLYVVKPNIVYDNGILNNYGLPSNIYATIGNNYGFVKIDDAKLTGAIPHDDKVEILNALKSGIYIV